MRIDFRSGRWLPSFGRWLFLLLEEQASCLYRPDLLTVNFEMLPDKEPAKMQKGSFHQLSLILLPFSDPAESRHALIESFIPR